MKWLIVIVLIAVLYSMSVPNTSSYREKAEASKATVQVEPLTEKGKKVKSKHSDWSNDICNTIGNKQVYAGMTADQAIAAWGKPYKINYTTYGNNREHEQWVMRKRGNDYLYFENGILTNIQGSK
jgi:type II secretory pathway pseudopilin PulG